MRLDLKKHPYHIYDGFGRHAFFSTLEAAAHVAWLRKWEGMERLAEHRDLLPQEYSQWTIREVGMRLTRTA